MIDPSIWADEDFGMLSSEAQILFIGIISNADDEGRLPGNALYLTSTIMPFKGVTSTKATALRDEIVAHMRSVQLYVVENREYIQLKNWLSYQSINKATESKYPPLPEDYGSTTVTLPPNRIEEKRIEEKGREERPRSKYSSFESLKEAPENELQELANSTGSTLAFVYSKIDDMGNWLEKNGHSGQYGKPWKNFMAALRDFVKSDALKVKERRPYERPNLVVAPGAS